MAVPPPASWIEAPRSIILYSSGHVTADWWCGSSADTVTGCVVNVIDSNNTTVYTTSVTTQSSTYVWSLSLPATSGNGFTAGETYTLQVYGYNSDGNGDAATATFSVYARPAITITSPSGTVTGLPLVLAWSITDTTGVASQGVFVYPQGGTLVDRIYYWGYDTDTRALSVSASEISLTNGETYTVAVSVSNGVGLQNYATTDFTVSWASPITPTATVTNDSDALATTITVTGDRTYTLSGTSATLSESGTITALTVEGLSEQDGTPTPSSPVTIDSVSSIQIAIDGTVEATIDLQGYELRSLPDGTHDELTIDEDGTATITQRVGSVTFDGSETWTAYNGGGSLGYYFYTNMPDAASSQTKPTLLCSHCVGSTAVSPTKNMVTIGATKNVIFAFGTTLGISTAADWKTWLASNPLTLCYKLATEQTISLGTVTLPWVDAGTMTIEPLNPTFTATVQAAEFAGQPAVASLMVTRTDAEGNTWVIDDSLSSGDTVTDPLPPLGVEYSYTITAIAASGATSTTTMTNTLGGCKWALNYGDGAGTCYLVGRNPSERGSYDHGGEAYHFADGGLGGGLPVWYGTTDRDASGSLEFSAESEEDLGALLATAMSQPIAWVRDPFGKRWRAHVRPSWQRSRKGRTATLDWDAVRWREAW